MHSIYMDVELWHEQKGERIWSCAYLAAVWQLLRLGMLRDQGRPLTQPETWKNERYPDDWSGLPPVIRVAPRAQPFHAFRTCTILGTRFLQTEAAVRMILEHVSIDPAVRELTARRAFEDGTELPSELVMRMSYVFTDDL